MPKGHELENDIIHLIKFAIIFCGNIVYAKYSFEAKETTLTVMEGDAKYSSDQKARDNNWRRH